ncbi:hypothetical protein [Streptacidiphilus jiangxiensis]|uniref:Uncharacterized protein n=1 Tax=Streptacidiphilus jiangxiensis TaxID=235985 RepID=A0A1H7PAA6_STRJI|nr:hypothetical protein [Streptacidiphilus jiangxiensis]SEL32701.1 hypothetical protein SAMN05414137_107291 [Streptacidiphilus jiangxiensis]
MKIQSIRLAALAAASAGAVLGTTTACISQGTTAPRASGSSSPTAGAGLPSFPTVSPQNWLLEEANASGQRTFTTRALASRAITVQLACAGGSDLAVSAEIFQGGAKPIYAINRQPCEGSIQKITLTTDGLAPLKIQTSPQAGSVYSLLITQG